MKTSMTELFGIEHPIMCGGMMWLAKPESVRRHIQRRRAGEPHRRQL